LREKVGKPDAGPSALTRFAGSLELDLCKQDLDAHFTQRTANWLLALLQRAVQVLVCAQAVSIPLLQQFRAVLVEDGSTITLPSALKEVWRGCGGGSPQQQVPEGSQSEKPSAPSANGSRKKGEQGKDSKTQASLKITVRWDRLRGGLDGPHLQDGRRHELASVLCEHPVVKGSLWMADLGYWALYRLIAISQAGAYFLIRYKAGLVLNPLH